MWLFVTSSQNVNVCSRAFVTVFVMCVCVSHVKDTGSRNRTTDKQQQQFVPNKSLSHLCAAIKFDIIPLLVVWACPTFTVYAKELTSQITIPTTSHSLSGLTFDPWINIGCCERCVSLRESFSGVRSPRIFRSGSLSYTERFWCLLLGFYGTSRVTQNVYMHFKFDFSQTKAIICLF